MGILYDGSCDQTKYISVVLLIPLNIVGTTMIGASNYVMQCLNAPTRSEVDAAHENGHFLIIGTPSIQNIAYTASWKKWVWFLLGASTVPVHLLLNSAVFASLQTVDYGVLVWTSDWRDDKTWDSCSSIDSADTATALACGIRSDVVHGNQSYQRLKPEACISQYANGLQSTASNVVLVTNQSSAHWSILGDPTTPWVQLDHDASNGSVSVTVDSKGFYHYPINTSTSSTLFPTPEFSNIHSNLAVWNAFDYRRWTIMKELHYNFNSSKMLLANQWQPTSWICDPKYMLTGGECTRQVALGNSLDWRISPESYDVDHCISLSTKEHCTVQYSLAIILTIIACDTVKLFSMSITLRMALKSESNPEEAILTTLGDAVESFLISPDPTSTELCLNDQKAARSTLFGRQSGGELVRTPIASKWQNHRQRWAGAASRSRWFFLIILLFGLLGAAIWILITSFSDLAALDLTNIWTRGIGSINPNSIFTTEFFSRDDSGGLLRNVIAINLPQLLFSCLYFSYNGICTCMSIAVEWNKFATTRNTLRVSRPRGRQRSSYWLSLPWRYSLPLVIASAAMHWLVSRSLFLVKIDVYGPTGQLQPKRNISACGFSILAILLLILLLVIMLISLIVVGLRRSPGGIPMVGACSWAISSMCHDKDPEEGASLQSLIWGVTDRSGTTDVREKDWVGHCCITSRLVESPEEGFVYM